MRETILYLRPLKDEYKCTDCHTYKEPEFKGIDNG